MCAQRASADEDRIVVKFMAKKLTPEAVAAWRRQLPDDAPRWGRCDFVFDADCREYDWLVAYEDLSPARGERFSERVEELACPAEHTILITGEPSSVKSYSSLYCRQYQLVITTQEPWALTHDNILRTQTGYPWFYGRSEQGVIPFDEIQRHLPTEKTELISTVCSAKKGHTHTMHRARFDFTERLEQEMPELVRYGRGIRDLDDKKAVLDPFRYHVAIENDSVPDYFTEKLLDPFLGLALPFYFGCTNAAEYFPGESFIAIDIFDFAGSLKIIRDAIAAGEFERRLPYIKEARRRVIEEHNMFALIAREVESRHDPSVRAGKPTRLYSRRALRNSGIVPFVRTIHEKIRLKRRQGRYRNTV